MGGLQQENNSCSSTSLSGRWSLALKDVLAKEAVK
jgi:hypothetical protein